MPCYRPSPPGTRQPDSGGAAVSGGRVPIPAGGATTGDGPLQACPDSGRGVSVLTAEYPPAAPSAHCTGVSGALSRAGRDPARAVSPSLYGSGPQGAGDCELASAGERATQRSADLEAIAHLTKGLALLKTLPDPLERRQQALRLKFLRAQRLCSPKGLQPPQSNTPTPGRKSCASRWGKPGSSSRSCGACCISTTIGGELQRARERAAHSLRLAPGQQDSALLLEAHSMLALTLFPLGEVPVSRAHAEQGIAMYNPQQPRLLTFRCREAPGSPVSLLPPWPCGGWAIRTRPATGAAKLSAWPKSLRIP